VSLEAAAGQTFDLLVIGGGINGAGIARDAALRGLSVCLLERDDFGGATTAASTRLIHGGLRYLQYGEIGLVRESLREREILLRLAPHLVRPLPFVLPVYDHSPYGAAQLRLGLRAYDLLAYDRSLPGHRLLPPKAWTDWEPHLATDGLRALLTYTDGQVLYPERLCLENLLSAEALGAVLANHTEVTDLLREANGSLPGQRVVGAVARDRLTGACAEVRARVVVNAAGPWVDAVNRLQGGVADGGRRSSSQLITALKGSHLVLPRAEAGPRHAIYSAARRDGRPFFIVPWGEALLVGTTEVRHEGPLDRVRCSPEEMEYLLAETNALFPSLRLGPEDVSYTYAGLRPLPAAHGPAAAVTRRHFVIDHARDGAPGLLSIVGGKLTTYRSLAEIAVGAALQAARLRPGAPCRTRTAPLPGGNVGEFARFRAVEIRAATSQGLTGAAAAHLVDLYGARASQVRALAASPDAAPDPARPLCPHSPTIGAQVLFAVREEHARTLADVLLRRTPAGLAHCLGRDAAPAAARLMAPLLGWDDARAAAELAAYEASVRDRLPIRDGTGPG
jgi:glycerol-3-phosphate dehydrogenase